MRRGVWHQLGYNSQRLVSEQLGAGIGIGAIISPKSLSQDSAQEYAEEYRAAGADILLDPEFYVPDSSHGCLGSYPSFEYRQSVSSLRALSDDRLAGLALAIEAENRAVKSSAVIAPAVPYEASRLDIVDLNARLFKAAKAAGDVIGIPTYATVVLGNSITTSAVVDSILSSATSLPADGWYYEFEFSPSERLPKNPDEVYRFGSAALNLACSDKPVLHACAGPISVLSFGAGATAVGIGFWQNLWGFKRERWHAPEGQGGGGGAPARLFSTPLWGTIVQPDELTQLSPQLRNKIISASPYATAAASASAVPISRWDSFKHLIHVIGFSVATLSELNQARPAMDAAITLLAGANALLTQVRATGIELKDGTDQYQMAWSSAASRLLVDNAADYGYLAALGR